MIVPLLSVLLTVISGPCTSLPEPQSDLPAAVPAAGHEERLAWWREARFGLFLHWGLYAIPAGEWGSAFDHGEWIRHTAEIPIDVYDRFAERFQPVRFDADAWVRLAKEAGMRYVVITTKHHDGFCLFDSAHTDYDVMSTPFRRDVMGELAEACRRHGLRICWYHSIMDWHHTDYLPRRSWEARPAEGADFERYVRYLHGQVEELLTDYGEIGVMWFDGEWEGTWEHGHGQALYDLCRRLQPSVIVNNRVDKGRAGMAGMTTDAKYAGDFGTPEQEIPATGLPGVDWETCMTMNGHWGYNRLDGDWKSSEDLVRKLVDIASKGGNFLLNIGPTAEGTFPEPCVERLQAIGRWMRVNGEAIHGTTASPFASLPWGRCTTRREGERTTLYLHVFDWPVDSVLVVPGIGNEARSARLLADPERALGCERVGGDLHLALPASAPDLIASVVALEIAGEPIVYAAPRILADSEVFVDRIGVRLELESDDLQLRYTLDGTEPVYDSPVLHDVKPLVVQLSEPTTVRARTFHEGRPVSSIVEQRFEKVAPIQSEQPGELRPGLRCERFLGDWNALPDYGALEAAQVASVTEVAPWHPGSGSPPERYGLRLSGWLEIPATQLYLFALESDDGSKLWIGDRLVVDNDGLHGPEERQGFAPLSAGLHRIRAEWFNKTGGAALSLSWRPLEGVFEPIPASALFQR